MAMRRLISFWYCSTTMELQLWSLAWDAKVQSCHPKHNISPTARSQGPITLQGLGNLFQNMQSPGTGIQDSSSLKDHLKPEPSQGFSQVSAKMNFCTLPVFTSKQNGTSFPPQSQLNGSGCVHMAKLFYTVKQRGLFHAAYGARSLVHTNFPTHA